MGFRCLKPLLSFLVIIIFFISLVVKKGFTISGPCSQCHTMHNSQNGQPVAENGTSAQPFKALTIGDCVFCHTGTNTGTNNIPYVMSNTEPVYNFGGARNTLAGGNFYWVQSDDSKGHNVVGITGEDGALGLVPPGYDPTNYPEFGKYRPSTWTQQLTCAGNFGCHGKFDANNPELNDPFAAISGAHHKNINRNGTEPADEVWDSYRFLWGIKGTEDPDYELHPDTQHHNGYYASTSPGDPASINYLCGECHGKFHSDTYNGTYASPWLRHPTDFDMNQVKTKEYGGYPNPTLFSGKLGVSAVGDYFADVPVGNTQGAVLSKVLQNPGDAIVLCLSCHRAHGSPYPDILRWDYSTCKASDPSPQCGCLACHTQK
ncbi:MAG: hypothetical protein GXO57_09240 [Thermodesulfobacteria bacterium]|nr:hypothetical protein [Thermodesulfobacteriota bacterium]